MSRTAEDTITSEVAIHALHYFRSGEGVSGGPFFDTLFRLAAVANNDELERLASIYPAEIAAFHLASMSPTGIDALRIMASLEYSANA